MSETNSQDLPRFPILRLPFLAMKNAVEQMEVLDIYKLSKSSEVCKKLVKLMKLKTDGIDVFANDEWSSIHIIPIDTGIPITTLEQLMETPPMQYFFSKEEDILPDQEDEGPKVNHVVPDHVDGCMDMTKYMNQLFEMKVLIYHFLLPIKSTEETINLLSRVIEDKCTFITVSKRSYMKDGKRLDEVIDKIFLDYLMDNLNLNTGIIISAAVPDNYNHENLFKFQYNVYNDASWVTMELLKSMRNAKNLNFLNMSLNSKEINEFISYVTNCEEDMMEEIRMSIKEENTFREDEVLDQLTTLLYVDSKSGLEYHLLKVRHPKNRKRMLIKFIIFGTQKTIHLETIEDIEPYTVQLEILDLMEIAKDLEKELIEIEEKEKQVDDQETLKELIERKKAINSELAEIRMKLMYLKN